MLAAAAGLAIIGLCQPVLAQGLRLAPERGEDALFAMVGGMYGVDPDLLAAIATVESGDRAGATSPKGAAGLMQLMPATARRFRVHNPYDPVQSAVGAARFLKFLRRRQMIDFDAVALPRLLAAYNAGEGAVRHYRGVPPFAETSDYVRKVLWLYLAGSKPPRVADDGERGGESTARERAGRKTDRCLLDQLSSIRRARSATEESAWNSLGENKR